MKSNIVQKIRAWRYPCDEKFLDFIESKYMDNGNLNVGNHAPMKYKRQLTEDDCYCNNNCKPERITITVERG